MSVNQLTFEEAEYSSDVLTSEMFGLNSLFTKDSVREGGQYDTFVDEMGANSFRFPGGTVTEKILNPNSEEYDRFWELDGEPVLDDNFITAGQFVEYANSKDATVDWVLPTEGYFSSKSDSNGNRYINHNAVNNLMDRIDALIRGEYGDVNIDTITIGNEYWYDNGDRSSAVEYGRMVNVMADKLNTVIENYRAELDDPDSWEAPKIAMQSVLPWDGDDIPKILNQIDIETRGYIDVIESHYYPNTLDDAVNGQVMFDRMDQIADAEGFGDVEYYVSEWNVQARDHSEFGMEQASNLIQIMETMSERGVDQASVWGTTYKSLSTRLARIYNDTDAPGGTASELTAAGEVMRMMSRSLEGTQVLDISTPAYLSDQIGEDGATDQVWFNAFGSDETVVIFISSRSADGIDLNLNIDELVGDYDHLWVQQLSTIDNPWSDWLDESDPLSELARPYTETFMGDEVTADNGTINLSLDGYDIVKLEFSTGTGVDMWGNDARVDRNADYNDTLVGTDHGDTIQGNLGDDTLYGMEGRDSIYGGVGDDYLDGGDGDDTIVTGAGNDTVVAGGGENIILAEEGENDIDISDGTGHLFVDTSGDTIITGFDVESGDTLSFMGEYENLSDLMDTVQISDDDLVFLHDAGGTTELIGAAGQLDKLDAALVDFTAPEETAETIAHVVNMDDYDEFADVMLNGTPQDVVDFLADLSPDQISDILEDEDLDKLLADIPAENLPELLNMLDVDNLETFFEDTETASLLDYLNAFGAAAADILEALESDPFNAFLNTLSSDMDTVSRYAFDQETHDALSEVAAPLAAAQIAEDGITGLPPEEEAAEAEDDVPDLEAGLAGDCFVATAAYQDKYHPDVAYLRKVRDHVLVHYALGRVFIWVYWRVGPWLARSLKPYPRALRMARGILGFVISTLRNRDVVARNDHGFKSSVYLSLRKPSGRK
ncbi:CFI-box-CTERM domain-containing protein [Marivivens niveibacter]|uniref:CFI-box-CTERM domain-containing protein n=1 Tax=Marivivens niveibacter TaxID=1930667 RepID=UPI0010547DA8|nr:CFI-box-CTERM domain-containing protein [Marivivens niveibacter]